MKSVLVVDDEAAVRQALKRVLDRAGYAVRTAANAPEGLAQLRAQPADIVITDIIMPKVDGVELIRSIAAEFPQVRIVAISGGGSYGIAEYRPDAITTTAYLSAAQSAGAHAVLTKPFGTQDVLQAITKSVLLVGDDDAVRTVLEHALAQEGYAVRSTPDMETALLELRERAADVAIVDIARPRRDGLVAIRTIADHFPSLRIVAVAGEVKDSLDRPHATTAPACMAEALEAGAHDVVGRPFELAQLLQAIGHARAG
jgi:CheY-like chemotaxis protein